MTTHTIRGFVTHTTYPWNEKPIISFAAQAEGEYQNSEYTVSLREHSFEVTVPDAFDPNPQKIAGMRAKIDKIKVAAFDEITNLQQEIEKLLSITYVAPAADTVFEEPPADVIELHTNNWENNDVPL